jgi:glycerol-3-phosphate acyltransferase PlsY
MELEQFWVPLVVALGGYLIGSFPTAVVTGYLVKGIDVRTQGSGNAGATNVVRVLGFKWGLLVGLVDLAKGALPVMLVRIVLDLGALSPVFADVSTVGLGIIAGIAALVGHALPLFAGFRGGKGVATGAGMVLALWPLVFLVCFVGFLLGLFLTGYVSVASLTAAVLLPISQWIFLSDDSLSVVIGAVIMVLVIMLHRKNLSRLRAGTEKRFDKIWILRKFF